MIHNPQLPLLTPREAANYLGVSVQTLATWRSTGRYSLIYVRMGRHIRYRITDLNDFVQRRAVDSGDK